MYDINVTEWKAFWPWNQVGTSQRTGVSEADFKWGATPTNYVDIEKNEQKQE